MTTLTMPTRSRVNVRRLSPVLGAEITGVDLREPLSDDDAAAIRQALLDHQVIFLRDQAITRDQHIAFSRIFASAAAEPFSIQQGQQEPVAGYPEILSVTADGKKKSAADVWHTDESYRPIPPNVSVLKSYVIPSLGGDTVFSSAVAAYEGLEPAIKAQIEYLTALHAPIYAASRYSTGLADPAAVQKIMEANPPVEQPVVRIHPETGRRTLYVNDSYTGPIVGLDEAEGEALKRHLIDQFKRPEYQFRFHWTPNAIAVWDNRSVQHYAVADYSEPRRLERVTLAGDTPPAGPRREAAPAG